MKKTNQRLLYLLPLLLTVALIVFGEALGELWKDDVKAMFQHNKWLLLAFVLLLALVGYLLEHRQRSEKTAAEAVDKTQYDEAFGKFKELLKEQYQIRLNSKTGRRLPINLTAKSTHFGTAADRVQAYFKDKELTIESENIASEIGNILETCDRLLLIGDPGAGKTTILLYAAINILNDAGEPKLPLLLNFATWSEGRDFAEWYAQSIAHTYSLSPVFVQELLRCNAVVPFFDGFDEIKEKRRDDCFPKMAAYFGDQSSKQLIVSSRKKEYAVAETDAPVYAEIEVQPLSLVQIKKALSENAQSQAADRALLHALDHDRWLAEAVETPFYLNTASFLFGKGQRTLADFSFEANSTEGRQAQLVEIFVAEQVPEEQDRRYLHFLAERMEKEKFLVFELVKMQPGWYKSLWRHQLVSGLPIGLLIGLFIGLRNNLVTGLFTGLFVILLNGLVGGLFSTNIRTYDIRVWRWHTVTKNSKRSWRFNLAIGLVYGLGGGLAIGLAIDWVGGLVGGLVSVLIITIKEAGTTTNFLLHLPSPYQRFWATFRGSFWVIPTLLLALTSGILAAKVWGEGFFWKELTTWVQNPDLMLKLLLLCLFFLILPLQDSRFIDHFALRFNLWSEGKMPLRMVTFMDRMSEQLIFEDNRRTNKKGKKMRGATWRFRHKILQDYFAGIEVK